MRISYMIAEAMPVIALFAVGYGLLLIGYGMGW